MPSFSVLHLYVGGLHTNNVDSIAVKAQQNAMEIENISIAHLTQNNCPNKGL